MRQNPTLPRHRRRLESPAFPVWCRPLCRDDDQTMRSAFKNIILVAVVLVVCGLLLELMTRLFVDDGMTYELEMWKYATRVKERDFRPDQGHKHGANRNASLMSVPVRTNEEGF